MDEKIFNLLDQINEHNIRPMLTMLTEQQHTIAKLESKVNSLLVQNEKLLAHLDKLISNQ